jgi:predicted nuclease of predicted toxin-antitoxin system
MMKVLLDTCVWGGVKEFLQSRGYDVVWVGDWDTDPGDEAILDYAFREQRVLITLDKDFGEWAILHRRSHFGIIRLVGFRAQEQGRVCNHILQDYQSELAQNPLITVEPDRVRIRYPE